MAKWQKKVAIVAAGSIVVGLLTIAAGAMVGGVEDVNRIYLAPEKAPEVITKEYDKISKLDLNLSGEEVFVEAADVEKVTVIETRGEQEYSRSEQSVKDGVLKIDTFLVVPPSEHTRVNTDLFSIFREMRRSVYSNVEPLRILVPKDMVLDEIRLISSVGNFLNGIKTKQLTTDIDNGAFLTLRDSVIDKIEGTISGSFYTDVSHIKGGQIKLDYLAHSHISESKLENLTIEGQHDYMKLERTLLKNTKLLTEATGTETYDSQTYQDAETGSYTSISTVLELVDMTFEGDVVIGVSDGAVSLMDLSSIERLNLDLTAEYGEISIDIDELPKTYVTDEAKSVYSHKGKDSKANVKVSVTNGNISLHD